MIKPSRNSRVFTQNSELLPPSVPEDLLREESKAYFWAFRRCTRPTMKVGWWQLEVANELQRFYRSLNKGERPKLVLMAPPQHGKTEQVTDLIAWVAGKEPDLKTIFASYSDELGVDVNRDLQRIMTSPRFMGIFGHRLADSGIPLVSKQQCAGVREPSRLISQHHCRGPDHRSGLGPRHRG